MQLVNHKLFLIFAAFALVIAGCSGKKSGKTGTVVKVSKGAAQQASTPGKAQPATRGTTTPPAAGGATCTAYATALCNMAGKTSSTCTSIKTVLGLIPDAACAVGMKDLAYSKSKMAGLKKVCDGLVNRLCKDLGEKTQTCKMVRSRTKSFTADRCNQMLAKYPQVVGQLKRMEARNKPLAPAKIATMHAPSPLSSFGPKDAKVTIVEFSDFECPYCSRAAKVANQIKKAYAGKVRFIFRHFPLNFHKKAHLASQASLAAGAQGKFWEYHDLLFANQRALGRPQLEKYAQQLKLDMTKFKKALDDGTYKATVDADLKIGKGVFVSGTPSMFLNGKRVQNATSFPAIKALIDAALK